MYSIKIGLGRQRGYLCCKNSCFWKELLMSMLNQLKLGQTLLRKEVCNRLKCGGFIFFSVTDMCICFLRSTVWKDPPLTVSYSSLPLQTPMLHSCFVYLSRSNLSRSLLHILSQALLRGEFEPSFQWLITVDKTVSSQSSHVLFWNTGKRNLISSSKSQESIYADILILP